MTLASPNQWTQEPLAVFRCPADIGPIWNDQRSFFATSNYRAVLGPDPTGSNAFTQDFDWGGCMMQDSKITFDQTMEPRSWAFSPAGANGFPVCLAQPRLLADQRSFALLCTVEPGKAYAMQVNPAPGFKNQGGRSAQPFTLRFTTTADITRDIHAALTLAGLADTDAPIMSWDDPGKGVSQSPSPDAEPEPQPAR